MQRRAFILAQYSAFDWLRLERQSQELQAKRDAEAELLRRAIHNREMQRAFWALNDAMCRVEESIGNPHLVDAKAIQRYDAALKRAIRSLKD